MNRILEQGYSKVSQVMQDATKLGHIIAGAVTIAVIIIGWAVIWLQPAAAAAEVHKDLKQETVDIREEMQRVHKDMNDQIANLTGLVELKIQQDNLKDVNRDIKDNDAEVFRLQQWVEVNGNDANSAKRLRDLKNERDELEVKRNCIINNNRACDS